MRISVILIAVLRFSRILPVKGTSDLCAFGLLDATFSVCCPSSCLVCGSEGCSKRPGGASLCCVRNLQRTEKLCSDPHQTRCVMNATATEESVNICWPEGRPLNPLPFPSRLFPQNKWTNSEGEKNGGGVFFSGRVDVLQVVTSVDCVVKANMEALHRLVFSRPAAQVSGAVHVIVTTDLAECIRLTTSGDDVSNESSTRYRHVRCVDEASLFPARIVDKASVSSFVDSVGPRARAKGGRWYWQQLLKLQAVSTGILVARDYHDNRTDRSFYKPLLGHHVKVLDSDTLVLKLDDLGWFSGGGVGQGCEVFDFTGDPTPRHLIKEEKIHYKNRNSNSRRNRVRTRERSNAKSSSESNDINNAHHYGALYHAMTDGLHLWGSHHGVAHGMSMTRSRAQRMLRNFYTRLELQATVASGIGEGAEDVIRKRVTHKSNAVFVKKARRKPILSSKLPWWLLNGLWVRPLLGKLCDGAAILGLSEYWYYLSFSVEEHLMQEKMQIKNASQQKERPEDGLEIDSYHERILDSRCVVLRPPPITGGAFVQRVAISTGSARCEAATVALKQTSSTVALKQTSISPTRDEMNGSGIAPIRKVSRDDSSPWARRVAHCHIIVLEDHSSRRNELNQF